MMKKNNFEKLIKELSDSKYLEGSFIIGAPSTGYVPFTIGFARRYSSPGN